MKLLSRIFAIDLIAYAIMSNHYHVVIRVDAGAAEGWSRDDVVDRWLMLYRHPVEREQITDAQVLSWRERLQNISWYMRSINESIARAANREDRCKGRFWEGRFKSQALLDERALLTCMTYVDLNPIRAGIATLPERSDYTSVKARIDGDDDHLMPLRDDNGVQNSSLIDLADYLQLVDWSGRVVRRGKRGVIPPDTPPILRRLDIDSQRWAREIHHYARWYCRAVGSLDRLEDYCRHLGQKWLKGMGATIWAAT